MGKKKKDIVFIPESPLVGVWFLPKPIKIKVIPRTVIYFISLIGNRIRDQEKRKIFLASIHKVVIASITIGVASILIALMVMIGFQENIKKTITTFNGDFEIIPYKSNKLTRETSTLQSGEIQNVLYNLPTQIKKVAAITQTPLLIHNDMGGEGALCKGLDPMISHKEIEKYIIGGRMLHLTESSYKNELIISHLFAKKLSIQVGDSIRVYIPSSTIRCRQLKVVGIYCSHLNEIDNHFVFCDLRLAQRLNNWTSQTVNGYEFFLKEDATMTRMLLQTIGSLIPGHLRIIKSNQKYTAFYNWLSIIQKNTIIFIVFILLIGGFTMAATIMIQLIERSPMIGLLQVIGAQPWQIHAILLCNSLRTLLRGILYGNSLGVGFCFLQYHYKIVKLEPKLYYINHVPIYWNLKAILLSNLMIFFFIVSILYISIRLLKGKKVIEALQLYEI